MRKLGTAVFLFLISCSGNESKNGNTPINYKEFVKNHCVGDRFAQGQDDDLYGLECLEGKQLLIKTSKDGDLVSNSTVSDSAKGLRLEGNLTFINKFYTASYTILKNQADDKDIPFLLNFFPKNEKFQGALNTEYRIIFKTDGNYLILYQASKNLQDFPYIELSSLQILRNNKLLKYDPSSYRQEKGDYYMTPFIGYPIKYCKAETIVDAQTGAETFQSRVNCEDSHLKNEKYIKVNLDNKKEYDYLKDSKKDLFLSDYFQGPWYVSEGAIEMPTREGELAPVSARLVAIQKERDNFNLVDMSGDVEERNRQTALKIPVKWLDFEKDQAGNSQYIKFGERKKTDEDAIKRSYMQIDFSNMKIEVPYPAYKTQNDGSVVLYKALKKFKGELEELTVAPDYFSYTHRITIDDPKSPLNGKPVKWKTSFLREKAVDTEGFTPRRWFKDDHDHVFGILWISPQAEQKRAEVTENALLDHFRMIRFNTSLNTEEEQKTKTKTIKWYFSKNSTKDLEYRAVAKKAVQIYNQAFEHISESSGKKIQVQLIDEEEKDLGDLRYNTINLVKTKDLSAGGGGLLGLAPSYVNPDTGQIIGTTANIIVHNQESFFDNVVRDYIRYEIFQKDKRTEKDNEIHIASPYLRQQIKEKCPQADSFIKLIKNSQRQLNPRLDLNDRNLIISCGKELTKQALLGLILHEMGHSFGLAHNFKASTDSLNYYHSVEEIKAIFPDIDSVKEIAHSSSVMDYAKLDQLESQYLGKYDLAALKYLYLEEMELQDGSFKILNINPEPKQQKALNAEILKKRKNYLHCSDFLQETESMCDAFDYGKNPKEIAEEDILSLKRLLNTIRYRYDLDEDFFKNRSNVIGEESYFGAKISIILSRTVFFYNKWLELRNNYLESLHLLDKVSWTLKDQKSIDTYQEIIKKGALNKEYALYEPIRDILPKTIMDLMDLDEMRCHVTDSNGKERALVLESIKNLLRYDYGDNLYVENCFSSQILSFFNKNDLTFNGKQTGYENFNSFYPATSPRSKWDVIPISDMLNTIPGSPYNFISYNMINDALLKWWNEPDKLKELTLKAQNQLLDLEKNKSSFESEKNKILLHSSFSGLNQTLNSPDKKRLLIEHKNNMKFVKYKKGTGPNSFYKQVTEPLSRGISISNIEVPFLETAYNQYSKEQSQQEFLNYLLEREDSFNNQSEQTLVLPFQTDSFSAQVITKYNETLNQIKELEKKAGLSDIEELHKEALKQHNKTLLEVIEDSRFY